MNNTLRNQAAYELAKALNCTVEEAKSKLEKLDSEVIMIKECVLEMA